MTGANAFQVERLPCAPAQVVETACREIAIFCADRGADLTDLTLVIPDLHAGPAVARALQVACGQPVLLLPRIVTLRSWAAEVSLDQPVISAAAQESALYRSLAERKWLAGADLWTVAAELDLLFAELTRWRVALPASASDFQARLDAAYRAKAGASFGFEARLIHELWHASHSDGALDPERAYMLQLAELAKRVHGPICLLQLAPLAPAEAEFLHRCVLRVPVRVFEADDTIATLATQRLIAQAWPQPARVDLPSRARALRDEMAQSPLGGKLRFFAAADAEEHAQGVALAIRRWLVEGRTSIAVVVLDRVIARRARALLERAEVLVRDEAGWALSTTSAATVIGRWLDALASDHAYADSLDLLKSPFIFHDCPREMRQQAVWRLEQSIRRASVDSGIARYVQLAERSNDHELKQLLTRLARAERAFARNRPKTLRGWLQALDDALVGLGVRAGLAADAAGIELLALLDALKAELEADALRVNFSEWRRWLAGKIEAATFRDRNIASPVIFTTLDATRLRRFDAVLLLGADANHLPGPGPLYAFFNQSVRRELGLPVRDQELRAMEQSLGALIVNSNDILVTWQRTVDDEENLLSPVLERLRTLHAQAWCDTLDETMLGAAIAAGACDSAPADRCAESTRPVPRILPTLVPSTISASGYNALVACPYQFYARYALKLDEADDVREEIEKSDYGERVHRLLSEFHRAHPRLSALDARAAEDALVRHSQLSFQDLIEHDYQAAAWLARWLALVPKYIEWQLDREADGWRFLAAEEDRTITIETPAGRTVKLRGRIDRVDESADGSVALVDYKTRASDRLRKALDAPGEDVQLPVYALLWGGDVAAAIFLSIDRDEVVPVDIPAELKALAAATRERLALVYDAIAEGAAAPAHGSDEVCRYCAFEGLCRRRFWRE